MRVVLWLVGLFAIAAVSALFAAGNPGTVTVFWPPYRLDLSLNMVLLALVAVFVLLHLALRGISLFAQLPQQARRWRLQQKERLIHAALIDSLTHMVAGRFIRSRKAAEQAIDLEKSVNLAHDSAHHGERTLAMLHLLAAESAHALQDRSMRDSHFQNALEELRDPRAKDSQDGFYLRAARWALDDHDVDAASQWLSQLPQGASRRTIALRLRFKIARLSGKTLAALETARLLVKHRAFSQASGESIVKALAIELLMAADGPREIERAWKSLDENEQKITDVVLTLVGQWLLRGGDVAQSRTWLLGLWERMVKQVNALTPAQRLALVRSLELGFSKQDGTPDAVWLSRIEAAQMAQPRDALLQYLAGIMCLRLQLWGKAQLLLKQALAVAKDEELRRDAQRALESASAQRA
jgi:HemY protein